MALPWASSLDVSYVGNHGYNRLGGFQGGSSVNLNAVDIGAAYLPQNQDPTMRRRRRCRARTPTRPTCSGRIAGLGNDQRSRRPSSTTRTTRSRRRSTAVSATASAFGANYTLSLSFDRQHRPAAAAAARRRTARSRSARIRRPYEELNKQLNLQRHILKANACGTCRTSTTRSGAGQVDRRCIVNDWQMSGVLTAGSGSRYDLLTAYNGNDQNNGAHAGPI